MRFEGAPFVGPPRCESAESPVSGLVERLKTEGYEVRWCQEPGVARAVDLQGWEVVYHDLGGGRRAILRCHDWPYPQTLIKRRE